MALVARVKRIKPPFDPAAAYLLIDVAGPDAQDGLVDIVAGLPQVTDAAFDDGAVAGRLWTWRESHTEAINTLGPPLKLDVTLPAQSLAEFVTVVGRRLAAVDPDASPWFFGHVADGNVHVNITQLSTPRDQLTETVLTTVAELGGSISTEHGIGRTKRRWLHLSRSHEEIETMRRIKRGLDPDGILNPGVLIPA